VKFPIRGAAVMRTFSLGLTMQALLSGANFLVGLILIRRTSDLQYSYYILATNALLLLTASQTSFSQPYIVTSLTHLDLTGRRDLVGGLVRANRRWVPPLCMVGIAVTLGLWLLGRIDLEQLLLISVSLVTSGMALGRELFRVTLFAYRRPGEVLRADLAFVSLLVVGVFVATLTPYPAIFAMAGVGIAALTGRISLSRGLWRYESWNARSDERILSNMTALGAWALTGSCIHWLLIQGYSYLVVGLFNIQQVAALAATRLTLMPIYVLSGGVSMLLFPITSRWVHDQGAAAAGRKLALLVAGLACAALCYTVAMWLMRDWIFSVVLKKNFVERDPLLILWSAVFLVTLCRDQIATLPASRKRFRDMAVLTGASAVVWLVASYAAMLRFGPVGAIVGILIGELVNFAGIIALAFRETRQSSVT
jgi:O-antigen/teichoic acid export membrane protein